MKSIIIFIVCFTSQLFGQNQSIPAKTNSLILVDTSKVIVDNSKRQPYKVSTQITSDNGTQISDSSVEVILDKSFQGTEDELKQKIRNGELEQYLVKENGKLYERIRVPIVVDNESFFEKHFLVICGIIAIGIFALYKILSDKDEENSEEEK